MLLEGLARRILNIIHQNKTEKIPKEIIASNHQRLEAMLDKHYQEKQEFSKRLKQKKH